MIRWNKFFRLWVKGRREYSSELRDRESSRELESGMKRCQGVRGERFCEAGKDVGRRETEIGRECRRVKE